VELFVLQNDPLEGGNLALDRAKPSIVWFSKR
jgi:hypothetical protein